MKTWDKGVTGTLLRRWEHKIERLDLQLDCSGKCEKLKLGRANKLFLLPFDGFRPCSATNSLKAELWAGNPTGVSKPFTSQVALIR
jgi:hypothetical protein